MSGTLLLAVKIDVISEVQSLNFVAVLSRCCPLSVRQP